MLKHVLVGAIASVGVAAWGAAPAAPEPAYYTVYVKQGSILTGELVRDAREGYTLGIGEGRAVLVFLPRDQVTGIVGVVPGEGGPTTRPYVSPDPSAADRRAAAVDRIRDTQTSRARAKREARDAYMASVRPQLDALDARIADAQAKGQAAWSALTRLRDQQTTAIAAAAATLQNDRNVAALQGRTTTAVLADAATVDQVNKVQALYQPQIEAAQREVDSLAPVYQRLLADRQAILNAAPH